MSSPIAKIVAGVAVALISGASAKYNNSASACKARGEAFKASGKIIKQGVNEMKNK